MPTIWSSCASPVDSSEPRASRPYSMYWYTCGFLSHPSRFQLPAFITALQPGISFFFRCSLFPTPHHSIVPHFFFFNFYLFIYYFWLCWVFVSVRGLSLVAASGGHSSSRCAGLSLSRPLLLWSAGSVVVAHGPSRSAACGIFPDQGWNPCPLHWQADSQPLCHQGSPVPHFWQVPTSCQKPTISERVQQGLMGSSKAKNYLLYKRYFKTHCPQRDYLSQI